MRVTKEKIADVIDHFFMPLPTVDAVEANAKLDEAIDDLIKSFGGCESCFGKGYATHLTDYTSSTDFPDHAPIERSVNRKLEMYFCDCERGQALKQLCEK